MDEWMDGRLAICDDASDSCSTQPDRDHDHDQRAIWPLSWPTFVPPTERKKRDPRLVPPFVLFVIPVCKAEQRSIGMMHRHREVVSYVLYCAVPRRPTSKKKLPSKELTRLAQAQRKWRSRTRNCLSNSFYFGVVKLGLPQE